MFIYINIFLYKYIYVIYIKKAARYTSVSVQVRSFGDNASFS